MILPGWVNVDLEPYPGVDRVLDVRDGLPFENVTHIFAEHFLEHFTLDDGLQLLRECARVLVKDGVLRISTPNLDWVWATSYSSRWTATSPTTAVIDIAQWTHDEAAARDCFTINRAFHEWGHLFLYNRAMLTETLQRAGFTRWEWCTYGRSRHAELHALEQHEASPDTPELPHVLVVEATR